MDRPHPLLDIHAEVLNIVRYLREVLPKDIIIPTPPSSSTQSQPLAQSLENIADKIYRQYLQESAAVHDDHDNATLPTYTHGKRTSVSFKRKTRGTRTESMALLASTVSKILEEEHVHDDDNNDDDPLAPSTSTSTSTQRKSILTHRSGGGRRLMGVRARNSNEKMVKLTTIEPKKMTVVATRKRVSTHTRNEINSDQHISSTIGFSEYTANGMIKDVSTGNLELVKVTMEAMASVAAALDTKNVNQKNPFFRTKGRAMKKKKEEEEEEEKEDAQQKGFNCREYQCYQLLLYGIKYYRTNKSLMNIMLKRRDNKSYIRKALHHSLTHEPRAIGLYVYETCGCVCSEWVGMFLTVVSFFNAATTVVDYDCHQWYYVCDWKTTNKLYQPK